MLPQGCQVAGKAKRSTGTQESATFHTDGQTVSIRYTGGNGGRFVQL